MLTIPQGFFSIVIPAFLIGISIGYLIMRMRIASVFDSSKTPSPFCADCQYGIHRERIRAARLSAKRERRLRKGRKQATL